MKDYFEEDLIKKSRQFVYNSIAYYNIDTACKPSHMYMCMHNTIHSLIIDSAVHSSVIFNRNICPTQIVGAAATERNSW